MCDFEGMTKGQLIDQLNETRRELDFFKSALDGQRDTILIYDALSGKAIHWNRGFCEISGYTNEEIAVLPVPDSYYSQEDLEQNADSIDALVRGEKKVVQLDLITKDQCRVPTQYVGGPFSCESREGRYVMVIGRDVISRKRLEERLVISERMRMIGRLAGGVAHDFNNQLAGIIGFTELVREGVKSDSRLLGFLDRVLLAADRSASLTRQLLAFSRQGKYLSVPIDMHAIVCEVKSLLERSIDKSISIESRFLAQSYGIEGDPSQIRDALLNVALNARDSMPEGGKLVFATSLVTYDKDYCDSSSFSLEEGKYIKLEIKDTGVGIDEAAVKQIFEPFYTTKPLGKSSGMGLAAAYGIVENHNGAIEVDSVPGKGTSVNFSFPLASIIQPAEIPSSRVDITKSERVHVMLVDDEETVRGAVSEILEMEGYKVTTCENGLDALERYKETWADIDLVVLDMGMPVMGGKQAFIEMKKINPSVVALLSSGYNLDASVQEVIDDGVHGFIQKPFQKKFLARKIKDILTK